jgi:hypothetical protein
VGQGERARERVSERERGKASDGARARERASERADADVAGRKLRSVRSFSYR